MRYRLVLLLSFLLLVSFAAAQEDDVSTAEDLEVNSGNLLELLASVESSETEKSISGDMAGILLDILYCWEQDIAPVVSGCPVGGNALVTLENHIEDSVDKGFEFDFSDGDVGDEPKGSGQLSVGFGNFPQSVNVGESPLLSVEADDTRTLDVVDSAEDFIGYGTVSLEYSPAYEESFRIVAEQADCGASNPSDCNLVLNDQNHDFSFLSPGKNTFEATAVAGDGVEKSVKQDLDVGVGSPPDSVDLDFSGLEGSYGDDWTPALDEDWDESSYQSGSTEKLAFVKDGFGNVVIDTGNSYLFGGAFLKKDYFGDENGFLKLEYRLRVEGESGDEKVNEFGIVTDSGPNSTVDLNSMSNVDLSESIDQTDKNYAVSFDLSKISDTQNLRIGVFPTPGFVQSDGGGGFGNGLRLILEDVSVVEGDRDITWERQKPDGSVNLVRGEKSTLRYKAIDPFAQFDLAKMNVSYELNRQDSSGQTEIDNKRCGAKTPGYCLIQFDFTPQKLGEYNITVGLETKTGKYFTKEYNYVSRTADEPNSISSETDSGDNGLFFKWIDNYDEPDLDGKKVKVYECVDGSYQDEPNDNLGNRCRVDGRCFTPGPDGTSDFSGFYNITLSTESQEKVIDYKETALDPPPGQTSCQ